MWLLIAVAASSGWWMVPLAIGVTLSFAMAGNIHLALVRAGAGQQALGRYAAMFEHVTTAQFVTPPLRALQQRLSAADMDAPRCMRRLNRILGFGELRRSAALLHFPIQSATLWDVHVLFALERWRRAAGSRVRGLDRRHRRPGRARGSGSGAPGQSRLGGAGLRRHARVQGPGADGHR